MTPTKPAYPVSVEMPRQERYSRLLALSTLFFMLPKLIILIPHFFVLYVLAILSFFGGLLAQIAVLFSGRYPRSLFHLTSGTVRWQTRVSAYLYGLTDNYPPFRLDN